MHSRTVWVAVAVLLGLPLTAGAQEPNTYTGCLLPRAGLVTQIAIGNLPLGGTCPRQTVMIHWNQQGPKGDKGDKGDQGLKGIQGPQGPPGPPGTSGLGIPESATVVVDCGAGQQIAPALLTPALQLRVEIKGICEESVSISRDNVSLIGAPGAGLHSTSADGSLIHLQGARNVSLNGLTLQGGRVGLSASDGASFRASSLDVSGAAVWGVQAYNTVGFLYNCKVHDNAGQGLSVDNGASFNLTFTDVYNNPTGVGVGGGDVRLVMNTTIRDNSQWGVFATNGARVELHGAAVTRNPQGLFLAWGAHAAIRGSNVAANADAGIVLMHGSVLALLEGAVVEANGTGVSVQGNSSVIVNNGSVVQGNQRDGVYLSDTSDLFVNKTGVIQDNGGWGVYCDRVPDVLGIHGRFQPSDIGPNTVGRISCPGMNAP
jgi:hypothetical protein